MADAEQVARVNYCLYLNGDFAGRSEQRATELEKRVADIGARLDALLMYTNDSVRRLEKRVSELEVTQEQTKAILETSAA